MWRRLPSHYPAKQYLLQNFWPWIRARRSLPLSNGLWKPLLLGTSRDLWVTQPLILSDSREVNKMNYDRFIVSACQGSRKMSTSQTQKCFQRLGHVADTNEETAALINLGAEFPLPCNRMWTKTGYVCRRKTHIGLRSPSSERTYNNTRSWSRTSTF